MHPRPIEVLPHKPSALDLGWRTATLQVWLTGVNAQFFISWAFSRRSSQGSCGGFLAPEVLQSYCCPVRVVGHERLLLISTLMASAMGFRKVVADQDWAREVFQPPPIQVMGGLPFTPDGFWQVFWADDGFFRLLLNTLPRLFTGFSETVGFSVPPMLKQLSYSCQSIESCTCP